MEANRALQRIAHLRRELLIQRARLNKSRWRLKRVSKDMQAQLRREVAAQDRERQLQAYVGEVERAIGRLSDPRQRAVLRMRYVHEMSIDQICETMGYGRTSVWRFQRQALAALELDGMEEGEGT